MRVTSLVFASFIATTALGLHSPNAGRGDKRMVSPLSITAPSNDITKSSVTEPFEVGVPLKPLADTTACKIQQFTHVFANSYGQPYVGTYQPPAASSRCGDSDQWMRVTLEVAEVLRTSTPEPTLAGIEWSVTKDITSVLPLLRSSHPIVMELDNVYNSIYNATLNITVSTTFYKDNRRKATSDPQVPDVVIPISALDSQDNVAGWFSLSTAQAANVAVTVPSNAYRAVLEVYASGHGCDEFWYSNPSDEYVTLAAAANISLCGGGPYREIQAFVDGKLGGVHVPFPTIYTGGIIPTLWRPVSSVHAFNLPPYYIDVTPFIGGLVDGKPHNISLAIANGGSYWFIDANLQLWLDKESKQTKGGLTQYSISPNATLQLNEKVNKKTLKAHLSFIGSRKFAVQGWVEYSKGRVETTVRGAIEYRNDQTYLNDTNISTWKQSTTETHEVNSKTFSPQRVGGNVNQTSLHSVPKPKMTMEVSQSTVASQGQSTFVQFVDQSYNITATVQLELSASTKAHGVNKSFSSKTDETQNGSGFFWKNGDNTETRSSANQKTQLKYRDSTGCNYSRGVKVVEQRVVDDDVNNMCK
ncbi:hypothetical protein BGX28_005038 [Mortierella sp. GBA30]|nr:hypothetical protein BGX28_005038 [Mortierella sp. GBA30]